MASQLCFRLGISRERYTTRDKDPPKSQKETIKDDRQSFRDKSISKSNSMTRIRLRRTNK